MHLDSWRHGYAICVQVVRAGARREERCGLGYGGLLSGLIRRSRANLLSWTCHCEAWRETLYNTIIYAQLFQLLYRLIWI